MRVLIAHALTPKRRRIARVLAAAGHDVIEVEEAAEALARCRGWSPDVALIHSECANSRINDTYGHKTGDEVLIAAAHAMGTHMRAEDVLGRLGGEEFLVLLPDTDAEAAHTMAERVRAEVATAQMPVDVTVSIGLATWDG